MSGVNLSQTIEEEESSTKLGFFDASVVVSLLVLLISGLVWGGIRFYNSSLDKKMVQLDEALNANTERIRGDHIDRIADFDARIAYFSNSQEELSEPRDILKALEGVMVSGIILTKFEYDHEQHASIMTGTADDFKRLAEQILRLKSEKLFSQVRVERIERNDKNRIVFSLKASF